MSIETPRLTLQPATADHLAALIEGDAAFERTFGVRVAEGYLEFPEALQYSLDGLRSGQADPHWWTHLFIHRDDQTLIGLGGYTSVPDERGVVEFGYGIAPAYRNQGYATEAARAFIDHAFRDDGVTAVIAHTLAEENASAAVLRKCGLTVTDAFHSPDDGDVWRWTITRPV